MSDERGEDIGILDRFDIESIVEGLVERGKEGLLERGVEFGIELVVQQLTESAVEVVGEGGGEFAIDVDIEFVAEVLRYLEVKFGDNFLVEFLLDLFFQFVVVDRVVDEDDVVEDEGGAIEIIEDPTEPLEEVVGVAADDGFWGVDVRSEDKELDSLYGFLEEEGEVVDGVVVVEASDTEVVAEEGAASVGVVEVVMVGEVEYGVGNLRAEVEDVGLTGKGEGRRSVVGDEGAGAVGDDEFGHRQIVAEHHVGEREDVEGIDRTKEGDVVFFEGFEVGANGDDEEERAIGEFGHFERDGLVGADEAARGEECRAAEMADFERALDERARGGEGSVGEEAETASDGGLESQ